MNGRTLKVFRRFAAQTQPSKAAFGIAIVFLTAASFLEGASIGLVVPLLELVMHGTLEGGRALWMSAAIEAALPTMRLRHLVLLLLSLIVLAVALKSVLLYTSELIISAMNRRSEHLLRSRLFERFASFGKAFFDSRKAGGLTDLTTNQVVQACDFFHQLHVFAHQALVSAIYFAMLLMLSWKLTVLSIAIIPPLHWFTQVITKRIMASADWRFKIDQEMSARLLECIENMSFIRSAVKERREAEEFSAMSDRSRHALYSIWKKIFFAPHFQEIVLTGALAVLLFLSLTVLVRERVALSAFLGFFFVLKRFANSVGTANHMLVEMSRAVVPMEKVLSVLEADEPGMFVRGGTRPFAGLERSIDFRGVGFSYTDRRILRDVTFSIPKGKVTALVGPTGAGKTTIASLIPRFYAVTEGGVLVDGVPIEEFDLASLRRKIAIVEQVPPLFNRTIRENIVYDAPRDIPQGELEAAAEKAALGDWIRSLPGGYETTVGDRGLRLSGGERQRIALARVLLKDPPIFIFDEATSALDADTEKRVHQAFENATRGRTGLVIAHRLSTIRRADNIVVIEGGAVTEQGAFDELIALNGRFSYYWNLQTVI